MPAKIRKRGENSYQLTVAGGYDGQGKQILHRKTVTASGPREAEKLYALFLCEVQKGEISTSGKMSLHDYFNFWLKNYAESRHEPKTILRNKQLFERIDAALGKMRLDHIQPKHLLSFYKNLAEPGIKKVQQKKGAKEPPPLETLSANSVRKHHTLLHTLLQQAVRWQLIPSNPSARVDSPKLEETHKAILSEDDTGRFLLLLDEEELKYKVMVFLSLATGLRRGELFGLTWRHIDFAGGTVKIEQVSQYLPGKGTFTKKPKTKSSARIISIPDSVCGLLKQYKADQLARRLKLGGIGDGGLWKGAEEPEDDFIFTKWDGSMVSPDSMNDWLGRFIKKHCLPPLTPHSLRHMAATFLITAGVDLRTVSGKLGHAQTSTTINYIQPSSKKRREGNGECHGILLNGHHG